MREGFHTVTVYLVVPEPTKLIDFVTQAFGAVETFRTTGEAGGMHAEVRIGDSMVMIGGSPNSQPMPTMLHLYLDDIDVTYGRALAAGATSIAVPQDHDDGDRRGGVQDMFGNQWYLATTIS